MGRLLVAVEDIRVQIGAIWPGDRADFRVNCHLCEQVVVPGYLLEYGAPEQRHQINHALGSVRERKSDSPLLYYFNFGDIDHRVLLREWVNGTWRFMIGGSFPTDLELVLVDADPFSHQANRSSWDLPIEDGPVECHPGDLPSISGMNVRWVVIAEEHQNRDPVEGADPGHTVNISVPSDRFDGEPPEEWAHRKRVSRQMRPQSRPSSRVAAGSPEPHLG